MRRDSFIDNLLGQSIGKRSFQAITDLNAHFPISQEYKQNSSVVGRLLAHAPGFCGFDGELFQNWSFELLINNHEDLRAISPLELFQGSVKLLDRALLKCEGVIGYITGGLWRSCCPA